LESRPLTFVHLSDIHFQSGLSEVSKYDLDSPLRHAILRDLKQLRERDQFKHFDGILISGDVAYAGKPDEYATAVEWINEIADVIGCDPGLVWCVPGNHDVDQSVQKGFKTITDTHSVLRRSTNLAKDLRDSFDNETNGPLLFQPLQAYNEHFGRKYGCPTTCKEPYWEDTLTLNDGSRLVIRGINSSYCSSRDDEQTKAKLIVGPMQLAFKPENDITSLVLCHHPPDWVLDGDNLSKTLNAQTHVQLFGHKHFHQHERAENSVVLSSGAVHPVRDQQKWEPRYYVLSLFVKGEDTDRQLEVSLYPRIWDGTKFHFLADRGCDSNEAVTETVQLEPWVLTTTGADTSSAIEEAPVMVANRKRLLHQFMLLPYAKQVGIVHGLHLFSADEMSTLTDTELFVQAFQRAKEKNSLEPLWNAIEAEAKSK
jgi:3',5'-cyclic AMP phosphodiesterase CpdA